MVGKEMMSISAQVAINFMQGRGDEFYFSIEVEIRMNTREPTCPTAWSSPAMITCLPVGKGKVCPPWGGGSEKPVAGLQKQIIGWRKRFYSIKRWKMNGKFKQHFLASTIKLLRFVDPTFKGMLNVNTHYHSMLLSHDYSNSLILLWTYFIYFVNSKLKNQLFSSL